MGAELSYLVTLEDIVFSHPIELTRRVIPYFPHLFRDQKNNIVKRSHAMTSDLSFDIFLVLCGNYLKFDELVQLCFKVISNGVTRMRAGRYLIILR